MRIGISLIWGAWWAMIDSDAPVMAGIAGGLLGAVVAGVVGHLLGGVAVAAVPVYFSMYAAAWAGYPAGAWCGVVVCNMRRRAPGSMWLALLGTLAGLALSLAFWEAIGREFVAGTAEPFPTLVWVGLLAVFSPVALIPGLASLAYDYTSPIRWWRSRAAPVPELDGERVPDEETAPGKSAAQLEGAGAGAVDSGTVETSVATAPD